MTIQQKLQHIADKQPQPYTEPVAIGSTPDGLGLWEGGPNELKSVKNWVSLKSHPTRTGDFKNTPGKASSQTVERSTDYFKQGNNTVVAPLKVEEADNIPCDDEPIRPQAISPCIGCGRETPCPYYPKCAPVSGDLDVNGPTA